MTTIEAPPSPELVPTSSGPYDPEMKEAGQLTSPTWELELFLSGAFVFAMFQLPGLIEQLFTRIQPHTTETVYLVVFDLALYAKAIAFTLIAMFVVHLVTRAYWVALMGIHSVFPRGIKWDELKMIGPISRQMLMERGFELPRAIAKLDNFCSIVFSAGLLIVLMFFYSTLLVGAMGGAAYGLALLFANGQGTRFFFFGIAVPLLVVPMAAMLVDRRLANRLANRPRAQRALRRLLKIAYSVNLMRLTGPMMWTLTTNIGQKKSRVFLVGALTFLLVLSAVDRLVNADALSINSYDYFGRSRTHEVNYRFYESQREAGVPYPRTPSIQADIIRDPYVKLFVPFYARRDNDALARGCPGLKRLQDRGVQLGGDDYSPDSLVNPVLDCAAKIRAVSVDDVPRPDLHFSFYENPSTGIKGLIMYIPVDSLPRGRHTIGILPVPPAEPPKDSAARADSKRPTLIPFWK